MSQREPPPSPFGDREMHRLFQALREHVVKVLRDFTDRVTSRIELLAEQPMAQGPQPTALIAENVVEASNMVVGVLRDVRQPETDPHSEKQPEDAGSDSGKDED